ncbi:MAG: hypothetical protein FJ147_19035 [Deltaproteobacteria bacterium]|nr:hypothetical protein [Deltaproteobacteria bacterium]
MAIYALSISHRVKGQGASAEAHAQYLAREGKYKERGAGSHAEYLTREGKHQKRAHELEATWSGNMPEWAENPGEFWNAADTYERANGRVYSEVVMALPRELSFEDRERLVKDFIEREIGERFPYTVAMHNSRALDGGEQPHAHIMFSLRERDGIEREKAQFFKRANSKHPERGGAKKNREWSLDDAKNDRVREIRQSWETLANTALENAGRDERIDRRTLKEQGIDREPEPKMGPEVTQRLKRGEATELGEKVIDLRQYREQQRALTDLQKEAAQEQVKVYLFEQEKTERVKGELRFSGEQREVPEAERRQYQRTVDRVMTRYEREDKTVEYRWKRSGDVAFVDKGNRLEFRTTNETAVKAGLQVAQEKGWQTVTASGSEEFRREAWMQARLMGVELKGYSPSLLDREEAMRRVHAQAERHAAYNNREGPTREHTAEPSRESSRDRSSSAQPTPEREAGRQAGPARVEGETRWVNASQAVPVYEQREAQLGEQLAALEKEREGLGWQRTYYDWHSAYPPSLTNREAYDQARMDYQGGRLREQTAYVQHMKAALQQAEQKQKVHEWHQQQRGWARYLPSNLRESWEHETQVRTAKMHYEQSVTAYHSLTRSYEQEPHRSAIVQQAEATLKRDAELQQQRQALEDRIRPIREQQQEIAQTRSELQQLAQRGKDPAVQMRWTQAQGWQIADRGQFRAQVRGFEKRERQQEQSRDRGWNRGR